MSAYSSPEKPHGVGLIVACALALGAELGCHSPTHTSLSPSSQSMLVKRPTRQTHLSPAALFASPDHEATSVSRLEPDGRRLLVSHGMRMIQHRDGTLERAEELLPTKDGVRVAALPPRLGGGYLFYVSSSNSTMIWLAREFTGKLTPLANLSFAVKSVVPGFDRLYLMGTRAGQPIAIDAQSGDPLEVGPLPPAPSYDALAFADAWVGAVSVPLMGVLASFDAGASWHRVPEATKLIASDAGPALKTDAGWGLLTLDGTITQLETTENDGQNLDQLLQLTDSDEDHGLEGAGVSARAPKKPLGENPLRLAVLHGVVGPKGSAYAAHQGSVARLRLSDGKILELTENSFPANAKCHGVRLGNGFGFVCSEERGKTTIYALKTPLSLKTVLTFNEPRYVADNEYGGLVVRGRCDPALPFEAGYYCLIHRGEQREIKVRGDIGAERVALLKDGSAAVIVPPRKGSVATLTRVSRTGQARQQKLKLPKSGPVAKLVREGIWLDGFEADRNGNLTGWVAGQGPFVGIRIKPNGTLEGGEVQNDIESVMISGRFALLEAQYGRALQTVNGGFDWLEVATLDVGSDKGQTEGTPSAEHGCSALGCATTKWLRVGWSETGQDNRVEAEPPERTSLPSPGGGRWSMHCYANGQVSPRALFNETGEGVRDRGLARVRRPTVPGSHGARLESTEWQPFYEARAPQLPPGQLGFDLSVEYGNQRLHAYVWGQRGASWDRTGSFILRVLDRFDVKGGVWSTELSKSPWPDELSAAAAFGEGMGGGSANWQFELEPSGREGLLLVRQPSQSQMFIVSEGRAITPIRGADIVTRTSGVVRIGSTWHFGAPTGLGFSVFKIVGDRIQLLNSYPFDEDSSTVRLLPKLVRNTHGDALAVLLEAAGKYFYPINLVDGTLQAPISIAPDKYRSFPESCGEDSGYVFTETVRVAPYVELMGPAAAVNASGVEARLNTSAAGVCLDVLAAQASNVLPESLTRVGPRAPERVERAPAPLVLSEQGQASRRWLFNCYP